MTSYSAQGAADDSEPPGARLSVLFGGSVAAVLGFYTILSGVFTPLNRYLSYRVLVLGMMAAAVLPLLVFLWHGGPQESVQGNEEGSRTPSLQEAQVTLVFTGLVSAYVLASFAFPRMLTTGVTRILVLSTAFICLLCYYALDRIVRRKKMSFAICAGQARSERIKHRFYTSLGIFLLFPLYVLAVLCFPALRGRLEAIIVFAGLNLACLIGLWSVRQDIKELENLLEKASKVAQGETSELIETSREGEMAELANAFNFIIAERNETIERLEEAKERIETLAERIHEQAIHDGLTGTYNRRFFETELTKQITRADRDGKKLALAILDIDNFKGYNDIYGHPAGDRLLTNLAEVVNENIRTSDTLCRYGGDEFTVIFPDTGDKPIDREVAADIVERLRQAIEACDFQAEEEGGTVFGPNITISAGVAVYPSDARDPDDVVVQADRRLYEAKEEGRNRVVSFTDKVGCRTI